MPCSALTVLRVRERGHFGWSEEGPLGPRKGRFPFSSEGREGPLSPSVPREGKGRRRWAAQVPFGGTLSPPPSGASGRRRSAGRVPQSRSEAPSTSCFQRIPTALGSPDYKHFRFPKNTCALASSVQRSEFGPNRGSLLASEAFAESAFPVQSPPEEESTNTTSSAL